MKYFGIIVSSLYLVAVFENCTGLSLGRTFHLTPPTTPVDEYATGISPLGKGGILYHNNNSPGFVSADALPSKRGESCSKSYAYLVAIGDSSIHAAKQNANISKVSSIEYEEYAWGVILYHKFCTIVYGE